MYLPPLHKEKKKNPLQFERSRNFVIGATGLLLASIAAASLLALRRVQERQRDTVRQLHQRHKGNPRVLIIGAGPCGSALAASITRQIPQTLVTVIEKDKTQVFHGQVPHAHAGHRSYDLNTSGGWDFLRSPTTWNVTREALLVHGSVLKVDPVQRKVMVRVDKPRKTTLTPKNSSALISTEDKGKKNKVSTLFSFLTSSNRDSGATKTDGHSGANAKLPAPSTSSPLSSALLPFRFLSPSSGALGKHEDNVLTDDGSYVDPASGLRVFSYDVLVIASGAQRTLGSLDEANASILQKILKKTNAPLPPLANSAQAAHASGANGKPTEEESAERHFRKLRASDLDKGSIALHPGTTRDLLAHLYKGEVLHVKVPPSSFVDIMTLWQQKRESAAAAMSVAIGGGRSKKMAKRSVDKRQNLSNGEETTTGTQWKNDPIHEGDGVDGASLPRLHPRDLWAFQRLQFPCRQGDATFVSTTNLIWKFLCFFNKLRHCPFSAVSADAVPFPAFGGEEESGTDGCVPSVVPPNSSLENRAASTRAVRGTDHFSRTNGGSYFFSEWNEEILSLWRAHQAWGSDQSAFPDLFPPSWSAMAKQCVAGANGIMHRLRGEKEKDPLAAQLATTSERWRHATLSEGALHSSSATSPTDEVFREASLPLSPEDSSLSFRPLHCTYVESVDPVTREVILVHYPTGKRMRQSYRILLLDLPMRVAGTFVEASGLHRANYVEEVVLPQLKKWKKQVLALSPTSSASSSSIDSSTHALSLLVQTLESLSISKLREIFQHEASFVDVDPETLQHHRYSNIFALGDAAGLPTIKSYAGGFSQVPVVSFNVQRVLKQQAVEKRWTEENKENTALDQRWKWWRGPSTQVSPPTNGTSTTSEKGKHIPTVLARYNGYTSFHVVMTPWRMMWPAFTYGTLHRPSEDRVLPTSEDVRPPASSPTLPLISHSNEVAPNREAKEIPSTLSSSFSPSAPLLETTGRTTPSWRGLHGFSNGLFCQMGMYELLYFFVYMRGLWYPPRWFMMPEFSPVDGREVTRGSWLAEIL